MVTHVQRLEEQMQKQAADFKAAPPPPQPTREDAPDQSAEILGLKSSLEQAASANESLKSENSALVKC